MPAWKVCFEFYVEGDLAQEAQLLAPVTAPTGASPPSAHLKLLNGGLPVTVGT